jgi:hypothetical protein
VTPNALIEDTKKELSEWIDMSDDPYSVVCNCLAKKICQMGDYIIYLERRVKDHDALSAFNRHRASNWED